MPCSSTPHVPRLMRCVGEARAPLACDDLARMKLQLALLVALCALGVARAADDPTAKLSGVTDLSKSLLRTWIACN